MAAGHGQPTGEDEMKMHPATRPNLFGAQELAVREPTPPVIRATARPRWAAATGFARTAVRRTRALLLGAVAVALAGGVAGATAQEHNTLSAGEREAGWRLLFDGRSLDGWRRYDGEPMTGGWVVEDGTLAHVRGGGSIVSEEMFDDFELALEWRVEPGGNSGIFYRAAPGEEEIFHGAPELQVLDDAGHADGRSPLTSAGANYGLHGVPPGVARPAREWNHVRIIVRDNAVEHWLNGERVVEYELGGDDWEARVAASKFAAWPGYGRAARGHIGLQDHGDRVWFRNIKLRELR